MLKISAIEMASIGTSVLLATTSLLLLPEASFALSVQSSSSNLPTPNVIGCPRGEIPFFIPPRGPLICIAIGDIFGSPE